MLNVCRVERRDPRFPVEVEARGDGIAVTVPSALTSFRENSVCMWQMDCICLDAVNCIQKRWAFFWSRWNRAEESAEAGKRSGSCWLEAGIFRSFYARVLEGMEALGILQSPEIDWEKYRPEALKARFEFDSDSPDELRLRPTLSYGDFTFFAAGGRACSAGDLPGCTGGIFISAA